MVHRSAVRRHGRLTSTAGWLRSYGRVQTAGPLTARAARILKVAGSFRGGEPRGDRRESGHRFPDHEATFPAFGDTVRRDRATGARRLISRAARDIIVGFDGFDRQQDNCGAVAGGDARPVPNAGLRGHPSPCHPGRPGRRGAPSRSGRSPGELRGRPPRDHRPGVRREISRRPAGDTVSEASLAKPRAPETQVIAGGDLAIRAGGDVVGPGARPAGSPCAPSRCPPPWSGVNTAIRGVSGIASGRTQRSAAGRALVVAGMTTADARDPWNGVEAGTASPTIVIGVVVPRGGSHIPTTRIGPDDARPPPGRPTRQAPDPDGIARRGGPSEVFLIQEDFALDPACHGARPAPSAFPVPARSSAAARSWNAGSVPDPCRAGPGRGDAPDAFGSLPGAGRTEGRGSAGAEDRQGVGRARGRRR